MGNLLQEIQAITQQTNHASQPTDYLVGTVTREDPLQIVTDTQQAPLEAKVLHLTEAVIEKKILLRHLHEIPGGGFTEESLTNTTYYENGESIPIENNYAIVNPKLKLGDKVLLLRVAHGQQFIVLSRVF